MKLPHKSLALSLIPLAAGLLASCAVGPKFKKPTAPPTATSYSPKPLADPAAAPAAVGGSQHFASGQDIPFDWWKAFQCPALNSLVERSLRANPTITAAKQSLRAAQELVYAQQGYYYPSVNGSYSFTRQQVAGNQAASTAPGYQGNGSLISEPQPAPNGPLGAPPYNAPLTWDSHVVALTVGYSPDIFGLNRRTVESLDAQTAVQRYELEAAYITLATGVVGAAIQEATTRAEIEAIEKFIDDNAKSLTILRNQRQTGYASDLAVAGQAAALAQAQTLLPPLQQQLEQTRDLIRALAGNLPAQDVPETFELTALHLPTDLPVSLPSNIIKQRPDVKAAEEQMRSANAQVGIAVANRLPQFTINGTMSGTATIFAQMLSPGGPGWNIGAGLSQPLFAGFTLLHRQRSADAALKQAAAQYQSTVISAYQNVADSLHALQSDANVVNAALANQQAAKVMYDLTQRQLQTGYTDYLAFYTAEEAYDQAVVTAVQAQAGRYGDTVALFQALGGGWWNRPEIASNQK